MDDESLKDIALLMTVNCVRNTVIEDYHGDDKITDNQMMNFNIEVSNKIYTFLKYLLNADEEEHADFLSLASMYYPTDWRTPVLDSDFIEAMQQVKAKKIKT